MTLSAVLPFRACSSGVQAQVNTGGGGRRGGRSEQLMRTQSDPPPSRRMCVILSVCLSGVYTKSLFFKKFINMKVLEIKR